MLQGECDLLAHGETLSCLGSLHRLNCRDWQQGDGTCPGRVTLIPGDGACPLPHPLGTRNRALSTPNVRPKQYSGWRQIVDSHTGGGVAAGRIIQGNNRDVLATLEDGSVDLVYIDPPFNTGRRQVRSTLRTTSSADGTRVGFKGQTYATELLGSQSYPDTYDDFPTYIEPILRELHRVLTPTGALYFHIDYREAHYCKVLLDQIFGRASFINEIIWAYDYGARTTKRWPAKHDTIFFYAKDPGHYTFNSEDIDREPYMAPGLVGPEKAARGKLPTDVWWHTIVSPTGKE